MSTNHSDNVTSDTVNNTITTTTTTTTTSQDTSDTVSISIHTWDSFSMTSHQTRYNTFEVDNFIEFDKVGDTDMGSSD